MVERACCAFAKGVWPDVVSNGRLTDDMKPVTLDGASSARRGAKSSLIAPVVARRIGCYVQDAH